MTWADNMVILSVDYGDARTGIAVSDRGGFLASPVEVINGREPQTVAGAVARIAAEREAQLIVMGLPKNMDGTEGFRAAATREFASLVKELSGIEVVFYDERLTTVSAHRYLNEVNVRGKKRKQTVDAVAAVIILQDYLDSKKGD